MNYIGMYLVNFLIKETVYFSLKNQSMAVAASANMPKAGLNTLFSTGNNLSSLNSGLFIAVLMSLLLYVLLEKTVFGYELKACGYNRDAARYAGINENRSIMASMAIAGAMAGLGGALLYLDGSGRGFNVIDVLAPEGFNGVPVALLAMSNPIAVIFTAIFVAYLSVGGLRMQLFEFAPQAIEIIVAIIIYFSALSLLIRGAVSALTAKKREKEQAKEGGE
jgi:simple sugar transport system permease protein